MGACYLLTSSDRHTPLVTARRHPDREQGEKQSNVRFAFRVLCSNGHNTAAGSPPAPLSGVPNTRREEVLGSTHRPPPHYRRGRRFGNPERTYIHDVPTHDFIYVTKKWEMRVCLSLSYKLVPYYHGKVICRIYGTADKLLTQFNILQGPACLGTVREHPPTSGRRRGV